MREYTNDLGDKVVLVVVYSRENVRVVHAPDICLPGGGFSICEKATAVVSFSSETQQPAVFNNYTVGDGSQKQPVFFLYKSGTTLTPNPLQMEFDFFINKALRRPHSAALIRLSYAVNGNLENATLKTKQFATEAMPVLLNYLP
jgi:EpsI family protein